MLNDNQRVILGDAIDTCNMFNKTFKIKEKTLREQEQREFLNRIKDDIRTVMRSAT